MTKDSLTEGRMTSSKLAVGLFLCCCLGIVGFTGCSSRSTSPVIVAEFQGGRIVESDLPRAILFPAEERLYTAKLSLVKRAVERTFPAAEAKRRGISTEDFLRVHVESRTNVSEEDVERDYADFLERTNRDPRTRNLPRHERETRILERMNISADSKRSFRAQVTERLRERLIRRKKSATIKRMIGQAGVKIYLDPPDPPVYTIQEEESPWLGPRTAPVTIVVFSDFQCPYSAKAHPDLKRFVTDLPDQVRLVFRHYPLPGHRYAQQASEAAALAQDQGKFWDYHDLLFANQDKIESQDLYEYARRLDLDMSLFEQGMETRKHKARILADLESGKRCGVRGTPAIYINGKPRRTRTISYFAELMPVVQAELNGAANNRRSSRAPESGVLAEVAGVKITEADLPRNELYRLEEALYYLKLEQTKELLEKRLMSLEAESRGISVDSLYRADIGSIHAIREVETQYEIFQGYVTDNPRLMSLDERDREAEILRLLEIQVDPTLTFEEQVLSKLTGIVEQLRIERLKPVLVAKLTRKYGAQIQIDAPDPPTYEIDTNGRPSLGPKNAPVTIVMFSDFECPYSRKVMPTIQEMLDRYMEEVRFVFHHFPLSRHSRAQLAHEASECAREQGKFWEYHDHIFAYRDALSEDDLKKRATDIGMDILRFNDCLETRRFEDKVRRDVREARTYNVNATPSFYVNGTPRDLRTLEQFAWHITGGQEGDPSVKQQLAFAGSTCK